MFEMIQKQGFFIVFICMLSCIVPVVGHGAGHKDLGKDWYCTEPESHTADYQKHVKHHISQGAEAIAAELEEVYADQSLTDSAKHEKTVEVLSRYLMKIKAGTGD